jgi:F-box/leucine-rich repeat protein 7
MNLAHPVSREPQDLDKLDGETRSSNGHPPVPPGANNIQPTITTSSNVHPAKESKRSQQSSLESPSTNRGATLDVTNAVRSFKLFQDAPEELIELLLHRMRSRLVDTGDEICREGEEAKAMYWIIRGTVAVVSRDGESKYAELHAGQFFG